MQLQLTNKYAFQRAQMNTQTHETSEIKNKNKKERNTTYNP